MEARYLTDLEWRICHAVNIYVYRNGRDGEAPVLIHVPPAKKKNMKAVMNVIQERVKFPVGFAAYLYKMDGTRVKHPCELEMYNNYVVASNYDKYFKCAQYGRKKSPLLVLNRESKHIRVLRLQNQNYFEWSMKKKALDDERPQFIYPTFYTNENARPQDLPVGMMGNYVGAVPPLCKVPVGLPGGGRGHPIAEFQQNPNQRQGYGEPHQRPNHNPSPFPTKPQPQQMGGYPPQNQYQQQQPSYPNYPPQMPPPQQQQEQFPSYPQQNMDPQQGGGGGYPPQQPQQVNWPNYPQNNEYRVNPCLVQMDYNNNMDHEMMSRKLKLPVIAEKPEYKFQKPHKDHYEPTLKSIKLPYIHPDKMYEGIPRNAAPELVDVRTKVESFGFVRPKMTNYKVKNLDRVNANAAYNEDEDNEDYFSDTSRQSSTTMVESSIETDCLSAKFQGMLKQYKKKLKRQALLEVQTSNSSIDIGASGHRNNRLRHKGSRAVLNFLKNARVPSMEDEEIIVLPPPPIEFRDGVIRRRDQFYSHYNSDV